MNITPLRLAALRILDNNNTAHASEFAFQLSPRRKWTAQGAVRWGCGYLAPLMREDLVAEVRVTHRRNVYRITEYGRDVLSQYE